MNLWGYFIYVIDALFGLIGSVVSMLAIDGPVTLKRRLLILLGGTTGGLCFTELFANYYNASLLTRFGIALLIGALWFRVYMSVIKSIKEVDFWALIKSRFGGKND